MHRSRRGGWVSSGNNVKMLATYGDDFSTRILIFLMMNLKLYVVAQSSKGDVYKSRGPLEAVHVKPGKVLFRAGKREVSVANY